MSKLLQTRQTLIMGIVNVTPDSFSDGGAYFKPEDAINHALKLAEEGADILDFGAESTRPGAEPVSAEVQISRLVPVITEIKKQISLPLSVDTTSAEVAEVLLGKGAHLINDISGMQFDSAMARIVADAGCPVVIMHIQGKPGTMQKDPTYNDVIADIYDYFQERVTYALNHGIKEEHIILDPGIGFGKTIKHNYRIIRDLEYFTTLQKPLLVGASRKSFIGKTLQLDIGERLEGSLAVAAMSVMNGARILRVHDVEPTRRVVKMIDAIMQVQENV